MTATDNTIAAIVMNPSAANSVASTGLKGNTEGTFLSLYTSQIPHAPAIQIPSVETVENPVGSATNSTATETPVVPKMAGKKDSSPTMNPGQSICGLALAAALVVPPPDVPVPQLLPIPDSNVESATGQLSTSASSTSCKVASLSSFAATSAVTPLPEPQLAVPAKSQSEGGQNQEQWVSSCLAVTGKADTSSSPVSNLAQFGSLSDLLGAANAAAPKEEEPAVSAALPTIAMNPSDTTPATTPVRAPETSRSEFTALMDPVQLSDTASPENLESCNAATSPEPANTIGQQSAQKLNSELPPAKESQLTSRGEVQLAESSVPQIAPPAPPAPPAKAQASSLTPAPVSAGDAWPLFAISAAIKSAVVNAADGTTDPAANPPNTSSTGAAIFQRNSLGILPSRPVAVASPEPAVGFVASPSHSPGSANNASSSGPSPSTASTTRVNPGNKNDTQNQNSSSADASSPVGQPLIQTPAAVQSPNLAVPDPGPPQSVQTMSANLAAKLDQSHTPLPAEAGGNSLAPAQPWAISPSSPVQLAQMLNRSAQSEMRIGLNTAAFGSVEVRTTVHSNEVGVLIGSEKGDLRSLLTNELPGIAHTLQQQNVQLREVAFQQGLGFAHQSSSGSSSQSRSFSRPARPSASPVETASTESGEPIISSPAVRSGFSIVV